MTTETWITLAQAAAARPRGAEPMGGAAAVGAGSAVDAARRL